MKVSLKINLPCLALCSLFSCDESPVEPRRDSAPVSEGSATSDAGTTTADTTTADTTTADTASSDSPAVDGLGPPPYRVSSHNRVQWKRYAAFEADLMGALELSRDQVCSELGAPCIREVHLVPLGGNEPYVSGLMKPAREPLATTPQVIDRVLLSACSARAKLDAQGDPKVFSALNLRADLPSAADRSIETTIVALYRRLLARDPEPREVQLASALAEPDQGQVLSAQDFATLACFSIGSTTEFLFF